MEKPSELQREYSIRFGDISEYRNSVWEILVKDYFQKLIGDEKSILDLGCGWGEFINNIQAPIKYAMDLNPEGYKLVDKNIIFKNQDCSNNWDIEENSLDVIFSSNFFEHLLSKNDLTKTLDNAYRALKPGGRIICLGPNIRYTGALYWDFYDHYLPLTHLSMAEVLRMTGFRVDKNLPKFLPYTMADGKQPPLFFVKLFLKVPMAWKFLGKQFLLVASKPS